MSRILTWWARGFQWMSANLDRQTLRSRAEAAEARCAAWERAADEVMVTNWVGIYDRDNEPKATFTRCVEHALDQERDALQKRCVELERALVEISAVMDGGSTPFGAWIQIGDVVHTAIAQKGDTK